MWEWLLFGLAFYGLATIWVQLLRRWSWWNRRSSQPLHFIILLYNSQSKVEWIFRSLIRMSRLTGRPFSFTFIDFGSSDDTLPILKRLTKGKYQIRIEQPQRWPEGPLSVSGDLADGRCAICIDLRMGALGQSSSAAS